MLLAPSIDWYCLYYSIWIRSSLYSNVAIFEVAVCHHLFMFKCVCVCMRFVVVSTSPGLDWKRRESSLVNKSLPPHQGWVHGHSEQGICTKLRTGQHRQSYWSIRDRRVVTMVSAFLKLFFGSLSKEHTAKLADQVLCNEQTIVKYDCTLVSE